MITDEYDKQLRKWLVKGPKGSPHAEYDGLQEIVGMLKAVDEKAGNKHAKTLSEYEERLKGYLGLKLWEVERWVEVTRLSDCARELGLPPAHK